MTSNLQSQTRSIKVCSIPTNSEITKNQTALSGSADIKFKIPEYVDSSDPDCSSVKAYAIYDKDCINISSAFENSNDIGATLDNWFLYAKLLDSSVAQSLEICLKVSDSLNTVTIPDLKLKVERDCSKEISKTTVAPVQAMHDSSSDSTKLFHVTDYLNNSDELNCPVTLVAEYPNE